MVYYLDYDAYIDMGGTLDETLFDSLRLDAQGYIDWYTFNRLWKEEWRTEDVMERVQICMYQLIRLLNVKANILTPDVEGTNGVNVNAQKMRESNDGVSVEYSVLHADVTFDKANKEVVECITRYLTGVMNNTGRKLMYRGLYPDE